MYFLIGISMLFGCFYAVHFAASVAAACMWRLIRSRAAAWPGRRRSDLLCALRIVPLALATTFTLAFVLPAFVAFEPSVSSEAVGPKLAIIAGLAAIGLTAAFARIFASWWRTRRLVNSWLKFSSPELIDGFDLPAYRIEHDFPVLAVVGIVRPRVFVAEKVLAGLDAAELHASIAHELGHIAARDNLKRIAMRLCADLLVFPFTASLDRAWSEAAETAADAAAAERSTALDLASALIKIGRLAPAGRNYKLPAGAYLLEPDDLSLAVRIEALVAMSDHHASAMPAAALPSAAFYAIVLIAVGAILSLSLNTAFLGSIHDLTEKVLAFLQ